MVYEDLVLVVVVVWLFIVCDGVMSRARSDVDETMIVGKEISIK